MEPTPLRVEVRGGDEASRQLLATSMTALLKKEGFKDVHGYIEEFGEAEPKRMLKTSVAEVVEKIRPDLFNTRIEIHPISPKVDPAPPEATLFLSAAGRGMSMADTRGDVKEFLQSAEDYGIEHEITVASESSEVVADAVKRLLSMNDSITVRAQIAISPYPPNMVVGKF